MPAARLTENMPRSGIVPPLVTASRWAPGRPVKRAGVAVPHEPGAQLGELVGRIAAGQQVERRVVCRARQRRERGAAAYGVEPLLDVDRLEGRHRDGLLGEDVERIGRYVEAFDQPLLHARRGDGRAEQVLPRGRERHALGDLADLVAGPADALQPAGDRRRRGDLDDEVDRAHVDAQLEARGRDDTAQPPGLELVLDQGALLLADRSVVRPRQDRLGAGALRGTRLGAAAHELRRRPARARTGRARRRCVRRRPR